MSDQLRGSVNLVASKQRCLKKSTAPLTCHKNKPRAVYALGVAWSLLPQLRLFYPGGGVSGDMGTPPGQAFQTQLKCDFRCRHIECATCAIALRYLTASRSVWAAWRCPRDPVIVVTAIERQRAQGGGLGGDSTQLTRRGPWSERLAWLTRLFEAAPRPQSVTAAF